MPSSLQEGRSAAGTDWAAGRLMLSHRSKHAQSNSPLLVKVLATFECKRLLATLLVLLHCQCYEVKPRSAY
jgi:hypothetical protein